MASKRLPPAPKVPISSPMPQPASQKPKSPPPSPPPPAISLNDLQDALKQHALDIKEEVKDLIIAERANTEELLEKKNKQVRDHILLAFQGLALHIERIDDQMEKITENASRMEFRMQEVENKIEITQDEQIISQYREMEHALRIRGLRENPQEDLKMLIVKDIAPNIGWRPEIIENEIENFFRVNSRVARQRNLPRDVVIYFSRRSIRNEIIQAFYKQKFQIADQDVIILKEIPPKILRARKDFTFLSDELKHRQIQFRWEIPRGIIVNYEGIRHRLTTVSKARDFYQSILKARLSPPPQIRMTEESLMAGASSMMVMEQAAPNSDIKEQRMTRAAHKRKEKEQLQKSGESLVVTEPVGGARPKRSSTADLQAMLQRLQASGDGQVPDLEC